MKILFFGDYSNLHACLASRLKKEGHDVTVVSDGGRYMDTEKDILLDRSPGAWNSVKYLYEVNRLVKRLKNYDVVQLINPHFLDLKPVKIKYFFDILKSNNRSVFLTLAGDDYHFVNACLNTRMFRFSEFKVGDRLTEFELISRRGRLWTMPENGRLAEHIYSTIDGAISILPEYDMASRPFLKEKLAFANIPVDLDSIPFTPLHFEDRIKVFIGIRGGMEVQKGTGMLLEMCREIERKYPELCTVECVSNLPLKEYLRRMNSSHIVLDQYYSYSPGTNALQAMALGKVAGTGGQPEYYEYTGENARPLIPLSPLRSLNDWKETLISLMKDPGLLDQMSREGRALVERQNDLKTVTGKFMSHWNNILGNNS